MRIAFLVTAFPAVSETFILDQITGLIDRGCEVEIFAAGPGAPSPVHPEVEAYDLVGRRSVPLMPKSYVRRPFSAIRVAASNRRTMGWPHARSLNFLRHGRSAASLRLFFETSVCAGRPLFDAIHCHFGPNGIRGLALRDIGALRGKLVTTFYGYDVSEFPSQRMRSPYADLFARGDLFVAISQVMREKLSELGCDSKRIQLHPLGVNTRLFPPRRRPAAPGTPVRILSIGRMVPKKGFEYGLHAMAELIKEEPNVEYLIFGDGPLRSNIERLADQLGLRNVVRLVGWKPRPEIVSALGATDILLAPSVTAESGDQEGTPVVIMEALASGVPVVSTVHAGIPEIVQDGVSGYLVRERDALQLSAALKRLIRDPELRGCMGRQGRAAMEQRHDLEKLNDRLIGIYRGTAAPPNNGSWSAQ